MYGIREDKSGESIKPWYRWSSSVRQFIRAAMNIQLILPCLLGITKFFADCEFKHASISRTWIWRIYLIAQLVHTTIVNVAMEKSLLHKTFARKDLLALLSVDNVDMILIILLVLYVYVRKVSRKLSFVSWLTQQCLQVAMMRRFLLNLSQEKKIFKRT